MTVRIYTFADKRPDFIPLQKETLDRFVQDEFEFLVYDNASSGDLSSRIRAAAAECGVDVLELGAKDHSDPTAACSVPLNWAFHDRIRDDDDISVVLDSDMFLLRPFSFRRYLGDCQIRAVKQRREHVQYLWNGIVVMKPTALPRVGEMSWLHGRIDGVMTDVGGSLYPWLVATRDELALRHVHHSGDLSSSYGNLFCLPEQLSGRYRDEYAFQVYANAVFHYKRGSNWDGRDEGHHRAKFSLALDLIRGCLDGVLTLPRTEYSFLSPEPDGNGGMLMNYWEQVGEPWVPVSPRAPAGTTGLGVRARLAAVRRPRR